VAFLLTSYTVPDYNQWKEMFDSDPIGRKDVAKSHRIFQAVDDPNHVFVSMEFDSADEAAAFSTRLLESGILDNFTIESAPTVVEVADHTAY
jgi:hypothetical protein